MRPLAAGAVAIAAALAGIAALGDLRAHLVLFVLLFFFAFAAYLGAMWWMLRSAGGRNRLPFILGCAALFRLLLLFAPPTLSDGLYRYVWEGRVLLAGASPYAHPPDDPMLIPLRDAEIWPHVNNPDVPSPYPPLAQVGGMAAALLTPHATFGMKLVSLAGDLAVVGALVVLLRRAGAPAERVLIYAWHPLTVLEFAHSGHNDALMLAPLVLALALTAGPTASAVVGNARRAAASRRSSALPAALLVAIGALAKVTPLLLFPLLPRRLGVLPVLAALALVGAVWAPFLFLGGGTSGVGSIAAYLGSWQDNDSVHAVLRELAGARAAKALTLIGLGAAVLALTLHPALRRRPLWWQAYVVLGLSIAFASTVHAWYLTWLLPFLAPHLVARASFPFVAPWSALAWLLLSGLVALPYLTYDTHRWQLWISFAEYVPFYALLAVPAITRLPGAQRARTLQSARPAPAPATPPASAAQPTARPLQASARGATAPSDRRRRPTPPPPPGAAPAPRSAGASPVPPPECSTPSPGTAPRAAAAP